MNDKYFYHATNLANLDSIWEEGLKPGVDGVVYLADTQDNALKFVAFRPYDKVVVIKIDTNELDLDKLVETHDHSELFFKCRAWGYKDTIGLYAFDSYQEYQRTNKLL